MKFFLKHLSCTSHNSRHWVFSDKPVPHFPGLGEGMWQGNALVATASSYSEPDQAATQTEVSGARASRESFQEEAASEEGTRAWRVRLEQVRRVDRRPSCLKTRKGGDRTGHALSYSESCRWPRWGREERPEDRLKDCAELVKDVKQGEGFAISVGEKNIFNYVKRKIQNFW